MSDENASDSSSSDEERVAIRDELKSLSFEELLKLKEKVGTKCYKSDVFKNSSTENPSEVMKRKKERFKRTNKNRPREESSKIPVRSILQVSHKASGDVSSVRDPRFETLCGEFNDRAFSRGYKFINDIREREVSELDNMYKNTYNPEEKEKIKLASQRLKNQLEAQKKKDAKIKEMQEQREANMDLIKSGMRPKFRRKGEQKALKLIDKYEELKSRGKLEKYMKKKNKKLSHKSSFEERPF